MQQFIWFLWRVNRVDKTNRANKSNRPNKSNKTNKANKWRKRGHLLALLVFSLVYKPNLFGLFDLLGLFRLIDLHPAILAVEVEAEAGVGADEGEGAAPIFAGWVFKTFTKLFSQTVAGGHDRSFR